jgi:hypothetical protein
MTAHEGLEAATRPTLAKLAERLGIQPSYMDQSGEKRRITSDATREALLAAMGIDASTEERAAAALKTLRTSQRHQWLEPVRVVRQRSRSLSQVMVRVPSTRTVELRWTLTLRTEEGMESRWSDVAHGGPSRTLLLELPVVPPLGYHDLTVAFKADGRVRTATQRLIVVPSQCVAPEARLRGRRGFGLTANLYSVRSAKNWGAGDFGDLATIAEWLAHQGGTFVGVNPLHALRNEGYDVSPYSPISRLFRNSLYLRVENIPELAHDAGARAQIATSEFQAELAQLREVDMLDYDRVMRLRAPVLDSLHRTFVEREVGGDSTRGRAYALYVEREDPHLTQFATFMAIADREGPDARQWPPELRDARSGAVARMREQLADQVDFHRWLQFEIDRQLGRASLDASDCTRTSPSARRRAAPTCGRTPTCSCRAPPWARRPTCTRTRDRTGGCRPSTRTCCAPPATTTGSGCCAPASGTPARCASTTRSGCSGCSGSRSASRRATAPT